MMGSSNITYFNKLGIVGSANIGSSVDEVEMTRNSVLTSSEENALDTLVKQVKANSLANFHNEARKLLAKKMNLNIPVTGGWTCLHYAAYMGRTRIAEELLKT